MFQNNEQVIHVINNIFSSTKIVVVGDIMLDIYLWGKVGRISPEAPVPVVHLQHENATVGGGGNVALNLAELGCQVWVGGVTGEDANGVRLKSVLQNHGIDNCKLIPISSRPTTTKTRIIGVHQQMMRLDWEKVDAIDNMVSSMLLDWFEDALENASAVILSDYGKGVLTYNICKTLIDRTKRAGIPVFIDPKGKDWERYRGATFITPNINELSSIAGVDLANSDDEGIANIGNEIRRRFDIECLLVTRSEKGMTLLKEGTAVHVRTQAKEVYDVSGAGDTVIATLAAGVASGLCDTDAVHLSNLAAGVVVGKVGTSPIKADELLIAINEEMAIEQAHKVLSLEKALNYIHCWRFKGEKVVFTNGCFDLLHAGHVTFLAMAKKYGDRLIVGLNADRSVSSIKGLDRPIIHEEDRAMVLAALVVVDMVILFDEPTPMKIIEEIKPDVLAKGANYKKDEVVGSEYVESYGGKVVLIPHMAGRSTTNFYEQWRGRKGTSK